MRRSRYRDSEEEFNVWPSFTDLMSNAFMILSLFLLLALIKSVFVKSVSDATAFRSQQLEQQLAELQRQLQQRNTQVTGLENQMTRLQQKIKQGGTQIAELEGEVERLKSPPVIVLRDSQSRRFESGSAEISPELSQFIEQELVPKIKSFAKDYKGYIIEVIGHTDGQINQGNFSNLDQELEQVIQNNQSINRLNPGSNADLGLMRALVVVNQLQNNPKLKSLNLTFKAYSAAQLYNEKGNYASPNRASDANRRRIEVRFTPKAVEQ